MPSFKLVLVGRLCCAWLRCRRLACGVAIVTAAAAAPPACLHPAVPAPQQPAWPSFCPAACCPLFSVQIFGLAPGLLPCGFLPAPVAIWPPGPFSSSPPALHCPCPCFAGDGGTGESFVSAPWQTFGAHSDVMGTAHAIRISIALSLAARGFTACMLCACVVGTLAGAAPLPAPVVACVSFRLCVCMPLPLLSSVRQDHLCEAPHDGRVREEV